MITIEQAINGLRLSTMHKGHRVSMLYMGYTKREALREFKLLLKTR